MINLSILTLQKKLFEGDIDYVAVPATDGWLGILPNHIPLIASLKAGEVIIKKDNKEEKVEIEKGFLEVRPRSEVVILASVHKQ